MNLDGKKVHIDQTNNSYVFPGLALGIIASKRVSDTMVMAAANELGRLAPTQKAKKASFLPSLSDSRQLSRAVAQAVGRQEIQDGQSQLSGEDSLDRELQAIIWEPLYVPYERSAHSNVIRRHSRQENLSACSAGKGQPAYSFGYPTGAAGQPCSAYAASDNDEEPEPHGRHHKMPFKVSGCCEHGNCQSCTARNCTCPCHRISR